MFKAGTTNEAELAAWIEKSVKKIPNGLTILDAGAGECQFKKYCGHLNYISQDFGQYDGTGEVGAHTGSWDNSRLDIISDITAIPLPDHAVDAVLCTEVFEHIPDPVLAVREFNRLIKPGGYLIITAPFNSLTHFAPYHFATGLSRFWYEKHLTDNNFQIEELHFNGNFFEFLAQESRRIKPVAKKYAEKKLNLLERAIIHANIYILQYLSKKDKGSEELLCYGLQVFARKKL